MKIGRGFDGSIAVIDNSGKRHYFDADESKELDTSSYKWAQVKYRGEGLLL